MDLYLTPLSSGDSSTVYVCDALDGYVVKKNNNVPMHLHEVDMYAKCTKPNITPHLKTHFIFNGCGYLQLEKIIPLKKNNNEMKFDISNLNLRIQLELIDIFTYLACVLNLIHMDSHIGNIGINQNGFIVVYDFEFTQTRHWNLDIEQKCAIAFSLFLVLDFVSVAQIESSYIWYYTKHTLGQEIFDWCQDQIRKKKLTKKTFFKKAQQLSTHNADIIFVCLASVVVLLTPLSRRFDLSLYKHITSVQRTKNKFL